MVFILVSQECFKYLVCLVFVMEVFVIFNGGIQKYNGNFIDEFQWKYVGFYFIGQNVRVLRVEVMREEKN